MQNINTKNYPMLSNLDDFPIEQKQAIRNLSDLVENNFEVIPLPIFETPLFYGVKHLISEYIFNEVGQNAVFEDEIQKLTLSIFYCTLLSELENENEVMYVNVIETLITVFIKQSLLYDYVGVTHISELSELVFEQKIPWVLFFSPSKQTNSVNKISNSFDINEFKIQLEQELSKTRKPIRPVF